MINILDDRGVAVAVAVSLKRGSFPHHQPPTTSTFLPEVLGTRFLVHCNTPLDLIEGNKRIWDGKGAGDRLF